MSEHTKEPLKVTYHMKNFNIRQIADSGQCFCIEPVVSGGYRLISRGKYAQIIQKDDTVILTCMPGEQNFWESYLDFSTDYGAFIASIDPEDTYLRHAAAFGSGIRILRQDLWEMIITFVISQQKTIPMIRQAIRTISEAYGTRRINFNGEPFWAFPSPEQLSAASLDALKTLKLGYRAKYIFQLCQDALSGRLDLEYLARLDYSGAMHNLMQFYGIGEKVANCICLFGLHHISAFPIDTWIQKILLREYWQPKYEKLPKSRRFSAIVRDHFGRYPDCAGIMQQYIFFYERFRQC